MGMASMERRDPLRRSTKEAQVMLRGKKGDGTIVQVGGKLRRSGQGGSWYNIMELQGFVISVL